jgi:two-component sensor histidine kinase
MSSDTSRSLRCEPEQTSIEVAAVANGLGNVIDLRDEEQAFELPSRLFEQVPFAIYVCDRDGLVVRFNRRAAELWGRVPKLCDPNERFCGSYRMFRPDGSLLPHHECPMADVLRTGVSVRRQEVHIERPDGLRGIALVDIEAIKDADGNIVGAVNCFDDITDRKQSEALIDNLAREAEHRTRNILATVQAVVQLTNTETVAEFKKSIEGRIQALATAHRLFVKSRWAGAELHELIREELAPYRRGDGTRVNIEGPELLLEPNAAQTLAVLCHELATNAAKYGALSVGDGRVVVAWTTTSDGRLVLRWNETGGPPVTIPTRGGFGTRVMGKMVEQSKGELRFDWRPEGLACELSMFIDPARESQSSTGSTPIVSAITPSALAAQT